MAHHHAPPWDAYVYVRTYIGYTRPWFISLPLALSLSIYIHVYVEIHISESLSLHTSIFAAVDRSTQWERQWYCYLCVSIHKDILRGRTYIYTYIYIYVYIYIRTYTSVRILYMHIIALDWSAMHCASLRTLRWAALLHVPWHFVRTYVRTYPRSNYDLRTYSDGVLQLARQGWHTWTVSTYLTPNKCTYKYSVCI